MTSLMTNQKCPMCRTPITPNDMTCIQEQDSSEDSSEDLSEDSSKIHPIQKQLDYKTKQDTCLDIIKKNNPFKSNKDNIRDELIRLAKTKIERNSETGKLKDPQHNVSGSPLKTKLIYQGNSLYLNSIYYNNNGDILFTTGLDDGHGDTSGENYPYYELGFIKEEDGLDTKITSEDWDDSDSIIIRVYNSNKYQHDNNDEYDYQIMDAKTKKRLEKRDKDDNLIGFTENSLRFDTTK
jgi:hypothetical protein